MNKTIEILNISLNNIEEKKIQWLLSENEDKPIFFYNDLEIVSNKIKESIEIIDSYNK